MRRDHRLPLLAALTGLALLAAPAAAQQEAAPLEDGRWLPYLGCWVDVTAPEGPMTCMVADGPGVAVLTVQGGEVTDRQPLRADGRERPADVAGCTGAELAEFSADGYRVYTRTELRCGTTERQTRGLMAMVGGGEWIEVRALGGEDGVAWVKRYRQAPGARVEAAGLAERLAAQASPRALEMARAAASRRIAVEDLIEANARAHPAAVRAWIAEHGQPLRLNADRLIELADAGVPPDVIDVAVAVSFPDRFAVGRVDDQGRTGRYGYDRLGMRGTWDIRSPFNPYYYDPYYYRYGRYSSYWGWGGIPGYTGYRPTVVIVSPTDESQRTPGRLVKGQGYTRGTATGGQARPVDSPSIRWPSSRPSTSVGTTRSTGSGSSSKGKAKRRGGDG